MKVVPVLDVLNGVVVHAVRGNRKEYQPLTSVLTSSVDPIEVAKIFRSQGFHMLYLADLDAILENKPNFTLYSDIAQLGFSFMVDAGVTDIERVKALLNSGVSKIVIGTETLREMSFIRETVEQIGANHVVVSLDVKDGQLLIPSSFDGPRDVFELVKLFCGMGVLEFILLDLSRVGGGEGVNVELLEKVLVVLGGVGGVYVGGGVGGVDDLLFLEGLGVFGCLFASVLHSGKISVGDLKQVGLF